MDLKALLAVASSLLALSAWGQNPDVSLKFDGRLDYRTPNGGSPSLRFYDSLGRPSLLQLQFTLEPGLRAFVSQRLQRIRHDGDADLLDEYYIEDQGVWRVGKQIVPFGGGAFLRETVLAARGDIDLPIEGASLAIAVCDGGGQHQRGFAGRLSFFDGDLGLSAMMGSHWGINGSSFALFRNPEDSSGSGNGLKQILGVDVSHRFGPLTGRAEAVNMGGRITSHDPSGTALDVSFSVSPSPNRTYTAGWTHGPDGVNFYRVMGFLQTVKNVFIEPMIRFRNGVEYDFSVQLHVHF